MAMSVCGNQHPKTYQPSHPPFCPWILSRIFRYDVRGILRDPPGSPYLMPLMTHLITTDKRTWGIRLRYPSWSGSKQEHDTVTTSSRVAAYHNSSTICSKDSPRDTIRERNRASYLLHVSYQSFRRNQTPFFALWSLVA